MGIIKAIASAIGGSLADQWLEVLEPDDMSDSTVFTRGVKVRRDDRRNSNVKGTDNTVSNGSVIHVYPNQFMMLVDGGKVVDYTAEEGYYTVNNSSLPSLFSGGFGDSLKETFNRIKYGGVTPTAQKVFFVNLQEIKGIKFGTKNALNYFDGFYNAELFLRTHGTYSIKITNPLQFFAEAIPKNQDRVEIDDINEQYLSEFLEALQSVMNQMSVDGIRISHVPSRSRELSQYMANVLDESWNKMRGFEVQAVGIASISYDDESRELINMRNKGAMLGDPNVREGYVQGSIARGLEAAGSNPNGSAATFMGMGIGMQAGGNYMGTASQANLQQIQQQQMQQQQQQAAPAPAAVGGVVQGANGWTCSCGSVNTGKFCPECGKPRPETYACAKCGHQVTGSKPKFCPECGNPF
ncbi:MAG: SPFH domain-containing protein [Eubacteriales bacterium]|jgi:membrane protease subunit (stomatin/prohibitin family)|nr:SPFH domain-containing protein [Eubacteriales bacterium]MDD4140171.1 SPFH domain-containing protein [Eubacteriales bacterium]MDD4744769.1 SPFH domain-containing protein [Eubacteriales bacterium]